MAEDPREAEKLFEHYKNGRPWPFASAKKRHPRQSPDGGGEAQQHGPAAPSNNVIVPHDRFLRPGENLVRILGAARVRKSGSGDRRDNGRIRGQRQAAEDREPNVVLRGERIKLDE